MLNVGYIYLDSGKLATTNLMDEKDLTALARDYCEPLLSHKVWKK